MSFRDFDQGIPAAQVRKENNWKQQHRPEGGEAEILSRWHESERRLSILRSFGTHIDHMPTREEMMRWIEEVKAR